MRKFMILSCILAAAPLLTGDTTCQQQTNCLHGPGPFNPNDYYYYWNMFFAATPSPPAVLSTIGDPNYPYHCYVTYQGTAPPPNGFSINCTAVAKAGLTQRQDAAGGTTLGACTQLMNDWIYADNESAYYNSIDGGVSMTVPIFGEDYEDTQQCTATDGCTTISNGESRVQDCGPA